MSALPMAMSFALVEFVAVLAILTAASFAALLKGFFALRRLLRATSHNFDRVLLQSPMVPGVSLICVARDASPETRALARRLLDLHFGRHELVLVLDGAPPAALECWMREFHLSRRERAVTETLPAAGVRGYYVSSDPIRLLVVEKEPGKLGAAYNAGVNAAQYPVIGLVDGEVEFVPEALLRLIRPMLGDWEHTVAVCGVAPAPPAAGLAGAIGAIESLRLWLARCGAFREWNKLLPVPGALMLVRWDVVRALGGFRAGPLELFVDLHVAPRARLSRWRTEFVAAPLSMRRAAGTWQDLRRQTTDDQRQLAPAFRRLRLGGTWEFLGLFSIRGLRPFVETAAYMLAAAGWLTGTIHPALAALVPVVAIGGGVVLSMSAVVLGELAQPSGTAPKALAAKFLAAIPENLGYRQLRNLWLMAGLFGGTYPQKHNRGRAV